MKSFQKNLGSFLPQYPIDQICNPNQTVFLDIETTGLHARSSSLYLIGCVYYTNHAYHTVQWFAENYDDEVNVLQAFIEFAKNYFTLIHFNGNTFDVPYLTEKMKQYDLDFTFEQFEGIDLFRRISPYKNFLQLENCKQQTIEAFLRNDRVDVSKGGDLIPIYHEFVLDQDMKKADILLLHNADDIKGLVDLCAMLAYQDLVTKPLKVVRVQANYYRDINQKKCPEIIMDIKLPNALPVAISYHANDCYFTGEGVNGKLRVPIYEEEMKYFYSNYKDYYYLPLEDMAVHKTVASYVDKEYREPAHASNCYTKKFSSFLPQWDMLFTPFFKRDYQSKEIYFELTSEFKTQRESFNVYAQHILQSFVFKKKNTAGDVEVES